jgi:hypothetical protein
MASQKTSAVAAKVAERYLATKNARFSIVVKDDREHLAIMKDLDRTLRASGLNVVEVNHERGEDD